MRLFILTGILFSSNGWSLADEEVDACALVNSKPSPSGGCERTFPDFRTLEEYDRIVNGVDVEEGEFPFLVSVSYKRQTLGHGCGGSVVSKLHVLTAAHCVCQPAPKASYFRVVAGTRDWSGLFGRSGQEQIRWGESLYRHPEYMCYTNKLYLQHIEDSPRVDPRGEAAYDYAILEVNEPFDLNGKFVAAIPLRHFRGLDWLDSKANSGKITCTVAGWGHTQPGGQYYLGFPRPPFFRTPGDKVQVISQKVNQTLLPLSQCDKVYNNFYGPDEGTIFNRSFHICAMAHDRDSCQGDSGGPFFCYFDANEPTLVGVVSFAFGCATNVYPGVYSRLDAAEEWIRTLIGPALNNGGKQSSKVRKLVLWAVLMVCVPLEFLN